MESKRQNFFSFCTIFCFFNPNNPENKNFEKMKNEKKDNPKNQNFEKMKKTAYISDFDLNHAGPLI